MTIPALHDKPNYLRLVIAGNDVRFSINPSSNSILPLMDNSQEQFLKSAMDPSSRLSTSSKNSLSSAIQSQLSSARSQLRSSSSKTASDSRRQLLPQTKSQPLHKRHSLMSTPSLVGSNGNRRRWNLGIWLSASTSIRRSRTRMQFVWVIAL